MKTASGTEYQVELTLFKDLLLRGSKEFASQNHPLNVLRAIVKDPNGQPVFQRPLWIGLIGERRDEITPKMAYESYKTRYDIEHLFRFGKQKLLLDAYQTPEVKHEEDWWRFVPLAYTQLYLASGLASLLPKPWERYLPTYKEPSEQELLGKTPTQVQRSFANILELIGTPAKPSNPRGRPVGRSNGTLIDKREARAIHFKSSKTQPESRKSISNASENKLGLPEGNDIALILSRLKINLKKHGLSESDFIQMLISSA